MDWLCSICNNNARRSSIATTKTLILLCMMQINCSTNAMDSVFANNSGSTSGGAIYTDVRAMSQYKDFESICIRELFVEWHGCIYANEVEYDSREFLVLCNWKPSSLLLLNLNYMLLHSESVLRYTLLDDLEMKALGVSSLKILKWHTHISYMIFHFWFYNICQPPTKLRYNSRNGSNLQNRIEYPLHSSIVGVQFTNNIYFPISNRLNCVWNIGAQIWV